MGVLKSEQKMFVFLILSVLLINTKCPKFTLGLLIMSFIIFFPTVIVALFCRGYFTWIINQFSANQVLLKTEHDIYFNKHLYLQQFPNFFPS